MDWICALCTTSQAHVHGMTLTLSESETGQGQPVGCSPPTCGEGVPPFLASHSLRQPRRATRRSIIYNSCKVCAGLAKHHTAMHFVVTHTTHTHTHTHRESCNLAHHLKQFTQMSDTLPVLVSG